VALCQELNPDFIFSFYYRYLLPVSILGSAKRLALNMHGSLLPKYRGRVPINWAIIHGETETGASLHIMTEKPDAGALIDQEPVPIDENDTAQQVFGKVTQAAALVLRRSLNDLMRGLEKRTLFPLIKGQYFGGRTPKDSEINWQTAQAHTLHNFVRALAPPFPSAFFYWQQHTLHIFETRMLPPAPPIVPPLTPAATHLNQNLHLIFADGSRCQITQHDFPSAFIAALPHTLS
jgi:methionyl-tRNA formyltransferase